jgi:hypothetical protein
MGGDFFWKIRIVVERANGLRAFQSEPGALLRGQNRSLESNQRVVETGDAYQLREPQVSYSSNFGHENDDIGAENTYFWDVY